jgi:lysophospholipase L1-like esterase
VPTLAVPTLVVAVLAVLVFAGAMLATQAWLSARGPAGDTPRRPGAPAGTAAAAAARDWGHSRGEGPELCHVTPRPGGGRPLIAVLGASYTAGVGAPGPADSWAVRLAELLGWRAVTFGVPGAGYTAPGDQGLGPMSHELARLDLAALHPAVVVVQAGHDDWQVPPAVEARNVTALVKQLRAEVPQARLAFLTVFSRPGTSGAILSKELAVDAAIGSAVRKADPGALVIDPLRGHWRFPRYDGGLHPDAHGHLLIAEWVAHALARPGVARPGVAQAGAAQAGVARAGVAQAGMAQAGAAQAGVAQGGPVTQPARADVSCTHL